MELPASSGLAIHPNKTLRLTDQRLLVLQPGAQGLLEAQGAFPRGSVDGAKVTENRNNGSKVSFTLQLSFGNQKHAWKIATRNEKRMREMLAALGYR